MPTSFSRLAGTARRRTLLVGAGALTIVAVGAGTTAAFAASSTPAPAASASASASTSTTAHPYPGVGAILRELPKSLRTDLKTLHKDSKSAKPGEVADIKKKALAGAYGAEIERVAHLFAGTAGGKATPVIPAALKADLKTLRGDAKGSSAREAQLESIWKKALAGSYGSSIETAAKAAETRYQTHQAHKSASGSTTNG